MKLRFLGTRGNIEATTRRHRRHSALEVSYRGKRVMVDCGADWRGELAELQPHALVITHAHPDHAFGLEDGAPCPVYATRAAWNELSDYPLEDKHVLSSERSLEIMGIEFGAFTLEHSTLAPAVGYRIAAGRATIFYAPDVVYIHERQSALRGVDLYVGDGATLDRSLVRRSGESLIGHSPIRTQLTWCEKEGIPRALFTHCGSQIVKGDERRLGRRLRHMAEERGVQAEFAHDGMELVLR
ncbi:MAG: MBL fold metallo-hydrolase [Gemmatimonadales bacterium]